MQQSTGPLNDNFVSNSRYLPTTNCHQHVIKWDRQKQLVFILQMFWNILKGEKYLPKQLMHTLSAEINGVITFWATSRENPSSGFAVFVCLCWGLTSQSTIFQSCRDGATASWVINQYFWGVKCLAQGHNTAVVGFKPPTSCSGVLHSTTEPLRSPSGFVTR